MPRKIACNSSNITDGSDAAFRQKIFRGDFRFIHTNNILNPDLHFPLIERRLATYAYEIVFVKAAAQVFGALPHFGLDLAAPIEKLEGEITAAVFGDAVML